MDETNGNSLGILPKVGMSRIGSLEVITKDLRSKHVLRGCSFTVERMDDGKFSNIRE